MAKKGFWGNIGAAFRSLLPSNPTADPAVYHPYVYGFGGTGGVAVNDRSALGITSYYRAVSIISNTLATLPLHVHRKKNNASEIVEHSLSALIDEPHPIFTGFSWRQMMEWNVMVCGNAYAYIIRDGAGMPVELMPLTPSDVEPFLYKGEKWHHVAGMRKPVRDENMLHFHTEWYDGICAVSPIHAARQALGLAIANQATGASMYENGVMPSGAIEHPQKLSDKAKENLHNSMMDVYGGPDNAGKVIILDEGMKFTRMALTPADMRYLETHKETTVEVSRLTGVPLPLLSELDRSTHHNHEQQGQNFVTYTMLPIAKQWEQELNKKLLTENQKGRYFFRFNLEGLLRADAKTRGELYNSLFRVGAITQNEIRAYENMAPIGADGDRTFIPLNMAPANILTEILLKDGQTTAGEGNPDGIPAAGSAQ